jgi:hypothetical protein
MSALGFIAVIVAGNLWFVQALTGGKAGTLTQSLMALGTITALAGGVSLGSLALWLRFFGPPPEADPEGEDPSE